MQRSISLLAACAVACSAPTRSRTSEPAETPAPTVEPFRTGQADVNLTGAWATGSAGEPAAKQIVLTPQCNYSPALWIIQQDGDTLRAWMIPESHAQGIATTQAVTRVPAEGWIAGVDLTMATSDSRYLLHYDSTSGHLRGTLNGAPFWAVRLEIVHPEGCIPVP